MVSEKISDSHHWPEQIEKHSKIAVFAQRGDKKRATTREIAANGWDIFLFVKPEARSGQSGHGIAVSLQLFIKLGEKCLISKMLFLHLSLLAF